MLVGLISLSLSARRLMLVQQIIEINTRVNMCVMLSLVATYDYLYYLLYTSRNFLRSTSLTKITIMMMIIVITYMQQQQWAINDFLLRCQSLFFLFYCTTVQQFSPSRPQMCPIHQLSNMTGQLSTCIHRVSDSRPMFCMFTAEGCLVSYNSLKFTRPILWATHATSGA